MLSAMASHDSKDSTSAIEGSEDFSRLLDHDIKGLKIGLPRAFFTTSSTRKWRPRLNKPWLNWKSAARCW